MHRVSEGHSRGFDRPRRASNHPGNGRPAGRCRGGQAPRSPAATRSPGRRSRRGGPVSRRHALGRWLERRRRPWPETRSGGTRVPRDLKLPSLAPTT